LRTPAHASPQTRSTSHPSSSPPPCANVKSSTCSSTRWPWWCSSSSTARYAAQHGCRGSQRTSPRPVVVRGGAWQPTQQHLAKMQSSGECSSCQAGLGVSHPVTQPSLRPTLLSLPTGGAAAVSTCPQPMRAAACV
jgi:hypothetical protein